MNNNDKIIFGIRLNDETINSRALYFNSDDHYCQDLIGEYMYAPIIGRYAYITAQLDKDARDINVDTLIKSVLRNIDHYDHVLEFISSGNESIIMIDLCNLLMPTAKIWAGNRKYNMLTYSEITAHCWNSNKPQFVDSVIDIFAREGQCTCYIFEGNQWYTRSISGTIPEEAKIEDKQNSNNMDINNNILEQFREGLKIASEVITNRIKEESKIAYKNALDSIERLNASDAKDLLDIIDMFHITEDDYRTEEMKNQFRSIISALTKKAHAATNAIKNPLEELFEDLVKQYQKPYVKNTPEHQEESHDEFADKVNSYTSGNANNSTPNSELCSQQSSCDDYKKSETYQIITGKTYSVADSMPEDYDNLYDFVNYVIIYSSGETRIVNRVFTRGRWQWQHRPDEQNLPLNSKVKSWIAIN